MALIDYIASTGRDGNPATKAYYRGMQERRAQETHGLQQMQREQTIQQNEFKLASQQRQAEDQQRQKETISNYKGDYRGLVDAFMADGDMEAAGKAIEMDKALKGMDADTRKTTEEKMERFNADSLKTADAVLQTFQKQGPEVGMQAYAEEYDRMVQQYPKMAEVMPDPRVARPEQVVEFNTRRRNRSLKHQEFDLKKRESEAAQESGKKQKLNLHWPGLDKPVKGRFNPGTGNYKYESSPGNWIDAPVEAQIVTTGLQGSSKDILGPTKSNITDLNRQLRNDNEAIEAIQGIITGVEANPGAVGFKGAIGEFSAGLVGQFGSTGDDISQMIESDDESQVRAGLRMLTGVLIPRVTGDTSGRYSDRDMERVDAINSGLKPTSSKRQTINALKTVLEVYQKGQLKTKSALGIKDSESQSTGEPKSKYSNLWGD